MAKTDGSDVALAKRDEKKPATLKDYIEANELEFKHALGGAMDVSRFKRVLLTAIRTNEVLGRCDPFTIIGGAMTAAQLGLELNTPLGQAYLIPYHNNKRKCYEAQFQMGYQGILDLAWRSGQYRRIDAKVVYPGDTFHFQYGLNPDLVHVPNPKGPSGEPIYYYALYELENGGVNFVVMSREELDAHAQRYSQAFKKGKESPWQTNPDMMRLKTCIIRLLKYAPKSVEVARAVAADEVVVDKSGRIPAPPEGIVDGEDVEEEPVSFDPETGEILSEDEIQAAFDAEQVSMEETPGE